MSTTLRPLPGTTPDPLYPDRDGKPMGETEYHILAITHLFSVLRQWYRRHDDVHVAADMLLYYEKGNPSAVRVPDVMVSKGVQGKHFRRSFRTWEEGVAPAMIIEVTSASTKDEDQFEKPAVYARLGVKEYFLFDTIGEYLRPRLQGFQLVGGVYVPMTPEQGDRLSSTQLGLDLEIDAYLLRVVDPRTGMALPTEEEYQEQLKLARREARKAKRRAAEAERHAADRLAEAQKEAEIERRRSAELEAEVARLRALLPPDRAP